MSLKTINHLTLNKWFDFHPDERFKHTVQFYNYGINIFGGEQFSYRWHALLRNLDIGPCDAFQFEFDRDEIRIGKME